MCCWWGVGVFSLNLGYCLILCGLCLIYQVFLIVVVAGTANIFVALRSSSFEISHNILDKTTHPIPTSYDRPHHIT